MRGEWENGRMGKWENAVEAGKLPFSDCGAARVVWERPELESCARTRFCLTNTGRYLALILHMSHPKIVYRRKSPQLPTNPLPPTISQLDVHIQQSAKDTEELITSRRRSHLVVGAGNGGLSRMRILDISVAHFSGSRPIS
jgi:hypothetical protein